MDFYAEYVLMLSDSERLAEIREVLNAEIRPEVLRALIALIVC